MKWTSFLLTIKRMAKCTCMAANMDKKSLHCSSKARSLEITFTSSATKEFTSST